jgi:hypothetical protein
LTKKQLVDIRTEFNTIEARTDRMVLTYTGHRFKNELAREYAQHGFTRRVGTLHRCLVNLFKIIPPGAVKIPTRTKLYDSQIQIQSFIANVFGCVDNLAWVWVYERELNSKIKRTQVGLRKSNTQLRSSLSAEFRKYLESLDNWFGYLTEYRDALAHRIPLYVPPGGVPPRNIDAYNDLMLRINAALNRLDTSEYDRLSTEQSRLLVFQPLMTHSIHETTAHYAFHVQMLADFLTVEELGMKLLSELKSVS